MRRCQLIVVVLALGACACMLLASRLDDSPAAGKHAATAAADSNTSDTIPDLKLELAIQAGDFEHSPYRVDVPGFGLASARLDPNGNKTRAMIAICFTSRTIGSARVRLQLLDSMKEGRILHQAIHEEQLGPERVVTEGHNLDKIRNWNDYRALWFDFPANAREATAIRVIVHLQRLGTAQGSAR